MRSIWRRPEDVGPFASELAFVVEMGIVGAALDFVDKDPGELFVDKCGRGILGDALVAQEFDAGVDPLPAFFGGG